MGLETALLTLKELRKNKELTKINKLNVMILSQTFVWSTIGFNITLIFCQNFEQPSKNDLEKCFVSET